MTIQEMQEKKKDLGYSYTKIAQLSGLPLPTVQKVLGGKTKSPRYQTVQALEKALVGEPPQAYGASHTAAAFPSGIDEYGYEHVGKGLYIKRSRGSSHPLLPHKRQGEYTWQDREMLPEDVRTELIDGVLYDMASPKAVHQLILMELSYQLRSQIEQCGKDCLVFIAPSDVWLTQDERNVFQPDIYVICDRSMIGEDGYTKGAPPFVIEILSPSTRSKDLLLKSYKYHAAGVHEYWIVDPDKRRVTVYDYDKSPDGTENEVYTFDEEVSVSYSSGACRIDFRKISDAIAKLGKQGK